MNEHTLHNESIDSLSAEIEVEDLQMNCEDISSNMIEDEFSMGKKRTRDDNSSEEAWTTVERGRKVARRDQRREKSDEDQILINEKHRISVTSKNAVPKQFSLARIFKENGISNVSHVKYVNKFRMIITFDKETSAEHFLQCTVVATLGWNCRKTSEVAISYGLIKEIDLDVSEDDILKSISCDYEVASVKRLDKRSKTVDNPNASEWIPSETVRLGFKGSSLPSYVYIFDTRLKVEPFVFSVTQCSRCWKFGHSAKMCPSKKIVCPKCTRDHENCEASSFVCINCKGSHMAFQKTCPIYIKEKKIRDLMAEFNCSYVKALTVYVPPDPQPPMNCSVPRADEIYQEPALLFSQPAPSSNSFQTFSDVVKRGEHTKKPTPCFDKPARNKPSLKSKQKNNHRPSTPAFDVNQGRVSSSDEAEHSYTPVDHGDKRSDINASSAGHNKGLTFMQLLIKMRNICMSNLSVEIKFQEIASAFTDWLITKFCNNISFDFFYNLFRNNG